MSGVVAAAVVIFIVLVCCNVCAFRQVVDDKRKAERGENRNRTPERDLLCKAWLGGIGGLLALYLWCHKVAEPKRDFMNEYIRSTILGLAVQMVIFALLLLIEALFSGLY